MKILLHKDLRERTTEAVQEVYQFLGVDPCYEPQAEERHNVTQYPSSLNLYHWIRSLWHPVRHVSDTHFPETADALRGAVRHLLFSKTKPEMSDEDRAYLREIYAEPNARLEDRLGRDLSHWK